MLSFNITQRTEINGEVVHEIAKYLMTWEAIEMVSIAELKKQKLNQQKKAADLNRYDILEKGDAVVRVALEEKLSGPERTYSSVTVRVEVQVTCQQASETIKTAQDILFDECTGAVERYIGPAQQMLISHLEKRA